MKTLREVLDTLRIDAHQAGKVKLAALYTDSIIRLDEEANFSVKNVDRALRRAQQPKPKEPT